MAGFSDQIAEIVAYNIMECFEAFAQGKDITAAYRRLSEEVSTWLGEKPGPAYLIGKDQATPIGRTSSPLPRPSP